MASETKYDDGKVSVRKWQPTVAYVVKRLIEDRMAMNDKDFVLGQIESRIVTAANRATAKLWGKQHSADVTLAEIEAVLTTPADKPEQKPTDEQTQNG